MALIAERGSPQQHIRRIDLSGMQVRNTHVLRSVHASEPHEFTIPAQIYVDIPAGVPSVHALVHETYTDINFLREAISHATAISIPDGEFAIIFPQNVNGSFIIECPDPVIRQMVQLYVDTHLQGYTIHQHLGNPPEHVATLMRPGTPLIVALSEPSFDA